MEDELAFEAQMIERGKAVMATDPKTGVAQQYSAHNVLAVHALRDGDKDAFKTHVCRMLDVVIGGFTDYELPVHPEKQIPLLFLAATIEEFDRADRLAAIDPETKDSHSFDIALAACLRAAVRGETPPTYRYKPTKSEVGLFSDIAAVGSDRFSTAELIHIGDQRETDATLTLSSKSRITFPRA